MDRTYSLTDLEDALRACDLAVTQTRRGQGGPIFTLEELKKAADALTAFVARARAEPSQTLTLHAIGDLLLIDWLIRTHRSPRVRRLRSSRRSPKPRKHRDDNSEQGT